MINENNKYCILYVQIFLFNFLCLSTFDAFIICIYVLLLETLVRHALLKEDIKYDEQ